MESKKYNFKVIKSGEITEIYAYENCRIKNIFNEDDEINKQALKNKYLMKSKTGEVDRQLSSGQEEIEIDGEVYKRLLVNVYRTRRDLKRLINANIGQHAYKEKFLTLTFDRDVTRDEALDEFKKFNKRMRYYYGDYEYIGVIELTEKMRIHFHIIMFGLDFIRKKEVQATWRNGWVKINAVDDYYDLANYIVKYIEKTLTEENFIDKHKKFYFNSKKLLKPVEVLYEDQEVEQLQEFLEETSYMISEYEYDSEHVGYVKYYKFKKIKVRGENDF